MDQNNKHKLESWSFDGNKKKKLSPVAKVTPVDVNIVLRVFKSKNEVVGFGVWNTYPYRYEIDETCGKPTNTYIELEKICMNNDGPPIIARHEAETYINTGDASVTKKQSLAHCFLFSKAEKKELEWGTNLPGFHFVTKKGLDKVSVDKWMRKDNRFLETSLEEDLTREMDASLAGIQALLEKVVIKTADPTTPGQFFGKPARYKVVKQIRDVPVQLMGHFERVINCADNYVSRPKDEIVVPANSKPMENIQGII